MQRFSSNCTSVLLLGDFNSHTLQLQDFVLPDREFFRLNDMSELYGGLRTDILYFEENSLYVTLHRRILIVVLIIMVIDLLTFVETMVFIS